MLIGIELPGIDSTKYDLPPTHPKVKALIEKLQKIIKLGLHHPWLTDFVPYIAAKNSYKTLKIIGSSKTIIYQKSVRCGNIVIRSKREIEAKVDSDGNCANGNSPRNPISKANTNVIEKCSPIHNPIPEIKNCVPEDHYVEHRAVPSGIESQN